MTGILFFVYFLVTAASAANIFEYYLGPQCAGEELSYYKNPKLGKCLTNPINAETLEIALEKGYVATAYGGRTCSQFLGTFSGHQCIALGKITGVILAVKQSRNVTEGTDLEQRADEGVSTSLEKRAGNLQLIAGSAGAGFFFNGINGLASQCVGGDYSSPRKATAAGIQCVNGVAQIVFGGAVVIRAYTGEVTRQVRQATGGGPASGNVTYEPRPGTQEWPSWENKAIIHHEGRHLHYWKKGNRHHLAHAMGSQDTDGEFTMEEKRSRRTMYAFFAWDGDDTKYQVSSSQIKTFGSEYVSLIQQKHVDEICLTACNASKSVAIIGGYYGYFLDGGQPEPQACPYSCA